MPPPDNPCPFGTAGLSSDEIADIDPDYLYFLRHVRPEGRGYVVEIPSKDGSSCPQVIRYEEPLAAPNAEPPTASCDGGTRGAPSSEEEHSSAAVEVPSGAASPPAGPDGEARGRTVPVERDGLLLLLPDVEPALYDSVSDLDEDYRFFPQHSRLVNDSQRVFETGKVKEEVVDTIKNVKEKDIDKNEGLDTAGSDLQLVNDMELEMEMEVDEEEEEKPLNVLATRTPESEPSNSVASSRQGHPAMPCTASVKEEVNNTVKHEGMDTAGSDSRLVYVMDLEMEMEVDKEEEEEEEPLNVSVMITEPSNREASSRQGHFAMPGNASELEGVIWPSHIVQRPESDFKRKLVNDLNRPFNWEEYDDLFAKVTGRTPIMKERRTRRRVTNYPCKHEMGKSYFDSYPDLADQVEGESSYPKRLALLRGFFFWLKNIGNEEKFKPWTDDFKKYRVLVGCPY